jgi:MFS family permease
LASTHNLTSRLFYGWAVVAIFLVIGITLYGIHFSFGVFFKSIESEFNLTRAATSAILSANMILAGLWSFFAGWAIDRYGPRMVVMFMGIFTGLSLVLTSQTTAMWQLFFTYSFLLAMGTGALYVVPMSAVSRWFDRKRGLALGLASLGIGLGTVIMAPFATYLITSFSWQWAYLIIGLIAWVVVIPLSGFLKRDPRDIGALPDGRRSVEVNTQSAADAGPVHMSFAEVLKSRSFWLFALVWSLFAFCLFMVFTHLVPHITDIGFSAGEAAAVLSLMGAASIPGRLVMGIVSDRSGRKLALVACLLALAGAMVWLTWAHSLWSLYIFALVFGFFHSGQGSSGAAFISETFGTVSLGKIFGLLEIGFGIGAAAGPALGGLVYDATGRYFNAFLAGAGAMVLATVFVALVKPETK